MVSFSLLVLFTRGRWVVKKGEISVYVVIEWPLPKIWPVLCFWYPYGLGQTLPNWKAVSTGRYETIGLSCVALWASVIKDILKTTNLLYRQSMLCWFSNAYYCKLMTLNVFNIVKSLFFEEIEKCVFTRLLLTLKCKENDLLQMKRIYFKWKGFI